jgi:hypothetical protein
MNSSLFYYFWKTITDARHIYPSDIINFPFNYPKQKDIINDLLNVEEPLMRGYIRNCERIIYGNAEVDQFRVAPVKNIIDLIDSILGKHYGFTHAELDFIINYDIKYRMGKELEEGEEDVRSDKRREDERREEELLTCR